MRILSDIEGSALCGPAFSQVTRERQGRSYAFLATSFQAVQAGCSTRLAPGLKDSGTVRRLGLIYRRDKALSKAALGFIQIILDNMGEHRAAESKKLPKLAAG